MNSSQWKFWTAIVGVSSIAFILIFDLFSHLFGEGGTTLSEQFWELGKNHIQIYSLVCMSIGYLLHHLFGGGESDAK